jgi:heme exporter protein CcmD
MNGLVSGGWGFVWAAYGVSAIVLAIYALHTFAAYRAHKRR